MRFTREIHDQVEEKRSFRVHQVLLIAWLVHLHLLDRQKDNLYVTCLGWEGNSRHKKLSRSHFLVDFLICPSHTKLIAYIFWDLSHPSPLLSSFTYAFDGSIHFVFALDCLLLLLLLLSCSYFRCLLFYPPLLLSFLVNCHSCHFHSVLVFAMWLFLAQWK